MATPPALPAPGGNALAAIADVYGQPTPTEVAINSGDTTTEGDMSFIDEDFDPVRKNDPRASMPGVLDLTMENHYLNSMTYVDGRTANVAVVHQGVDPGLASDLMNAQREALQSEANARHSEAMVRQRSVWLSEARDHIANMEQQAAHELNQKNLQLNEQAAHAVSDADNQRRDFEREIGRLRQEQEQLMKQLKDGSLGGTLRPGTNYQPGTEPPSASHHSRAAGSGIHQVPAKVVISDDDADDERSITVPPGLPPGGPPGGGDDDDDPGDDRDDRGRRRGKKDKKEKKSVPFHWTTAAGNGKPTSTPTKTSRVSAVGAESDDEGYEASIADTEGLPGAHELDDFEEGYPGELAPLPPAAVTPDFDGGSDAEGEAPEPVDGRLVGTT
eukprot:s1266_g16.t1